jgi:adenosine deaminase
MNCQKNQDKLSIGEVMDAVLDGMDKGSEELGVKTRFIASINRSYDPRDAMKIVNEAIKRKDRGVVGIDLAGDERHKPEKFKEVFAHARKNGLQVTVHAGEALGPSSIEEAMDELGAERIGHGTRLREDRRVLEKVRDHDVHLEMCPHSNRLLNVVDSMRNYPIREYINEGISCSLNTDDKHIFDVNLIDEYKAMAGVNEFTLQELQNLNLRAIEHVFLPMVDKKQLIAQFKADYDRMNKSILEGHESASLGHIAA